MIPFNFWLLATITVWILIINEITAQPTVMPDYDEEGFYIGHVTVYRGVLGRLFKPRYHATKAESRKYWRSL